MADYDEEFSEFVAARSAALLRLAYLLTGESFAAQDVLQDALVRAYLRWRRIRTSPEAYVRRVVVTAAADEARRRGRRREVLTATLPDRTASDPVEAGVDPRDQLVAALRGLPARQRAAVVLLHWLGLGPDEVASLLGCSASTVRSQAARGVAKLRGAYAPADDTQEETTA
jgi:RNA polymerase sigma-70 factor (sigma-E family)